MMRLYLLTLLVALFSFIQDGKSQVESLTEVTVHNKTPKQIYDFMFSLTLEKYLKWHPEHKDFKIIKATSDIVESVFYFNEVINGNKSEYNWTVTEIEKNKKIVMKTSKMSVPLIIEIVFKEDGNNTLVTHHLKVGKGMTNWIVKCFFTDDVIKDLHKHVEEEYKNLEWLII